MLRTRRNRFGIWVLVMTLAMAFAGSALAQSARVVPEDAAEVRLSFAPVVAEAAPAVVNVYATRVSQTGNSVFSDPFFQRFFGRRAPRQRESQSLGSGVIVDPTGIIVTNNHVIEGATDIRITTATGREFRTELLLVDPDTDLAVLRITNPGGRSFAALEFADSDDLLVGDLVLAIGNPFGVGQTVTNGIVSALARSGVGVSDFQSFIQTDAAINPGNSGGALVDLDGRLVGINTAIFTRSGGSNGIGFAIPANLARVVAEAGMRGEELQRAWVGVRLQDMTSDVADGLGMEELGGAIVTTVFPGSAAERAGIQDGDVIVSVAGRRISGEGEFGYRIATQQVGATVDMELLRGGQVVHVAVPLEAGPPGGAGDALIITGRTAFAGAHAMTVTPFVADQLGLRVQDRGVAIVEVEANSPAARIGLQKGDVILKLNGFELNDASLFEQVALSGSRRWDIEMVRGNRTIRRIFGG